MTSDPRRGAEKGRLLNDEETKIWEAADCGTDDTNPAWRALLGKLAAEVEQEREAEANAPFVTCTKCGERCGRLSWRTLGEELRVISTCCFSPLPPDRGAPAENNDGPADPGP